MITDAQNIMSEFGRLFYIGRSFVLRNIVIDWGISTSANDHGKTRSRQVPRQVQDLYPDQQLVVLSLIRGPGFVIPRFVAISGQKDGAGDRIEFKVPVTEVQWPDQPEISPLHTAAARRMIANDLQDISDPGSISQLRRRDIVDLAQQYKVVTPFTRFVPVERFEKPTSPASPLKKSRSNGTHRAKLGLGLVSPFFSRIWTKDPVTKTPSPVLKKAVVRKTVSPSPSESKKQKPADKRSQSRDDYDNSLRAHNPTPSASHPNEGLASPTMDASTLFESHISLLPSASPSRVNVITNNTTIPPPQLVEPVLCPAEVALPDATSTGAAPLPLDAEAQELIQLRSPDGSWDSGPRFVAIVGDHPFHHDSTSLSNEQLWWTALAIVFLKRRLRGHRSYSDLILSKSMEFGYRAASVSGDNFDELVHLAEDQFDESASQQIHVLEEANTITDVEGEGSGTVLPEEEKHRELSKGSLGRNYFSLSCVMVSAVILFIILLLGLSAGPDFHSGSIDIFVIKIDYLATPPEFHFGFWGIVSSDCR